ncbi:asparaginase [Georgenia daeguensis]|uniref:asparaginase n=1 Tax=Georgenia daeguensis TaxID=908355 RepID=A0ABP8EU78_9MICO
MPRLTLLATGGTIATRATGAGRVVGATGAELLERARGVWGFDGEVDVLDVEGLVSSALTVPAVLGLAGTVRQALAASDGVVVTHGTDTMEETAFLLGLTLGPSAPVTLTGAQRPFDDAAPDGPRNLAAALAWAADPAAEGTGVTITFADVVLPAVGVHKTKTLGLEAFAAPTRGPIGHVDETGVRRHARPEIPGPLLPPGTADLPRVAVVPQYLGVDAADVEAAVRGGARGLVVAGFGAGNTTPPVTAALVRLLERGLPVVVTSRTGSGAVAGLYAGGGADLAAAGAVMAGDLSHWQARLLLAAVLATQDDDGRDRDGEDWATRTRRWLADAGAVPRRAEAAVRK